METFNIIAGIASILSLVISFVTFQKVQEIHNNVKGNNIMNNKVSQNHSSEINNGVINQVGIVGRDNK